MLYENKFQDQDAYYGNSPGSSGYRYGQGTVYHSYSGYDPEGLAPLTNTLKEYEILRRILEYEGGGIELIREITALMNKKVNISGPYNKEDKVSLSDPDQIRILLRTVGQTDLKFSVRRLGHGLPVYYLARVHKDWWGLYSLIVEDVHLSPGYPLLDQRFARLMTHGKERYYLRLSLFRSQVAKMFSESGAQVEAHTDDLLYDLGRCIFQGTWHTDQRFVFVFSDVFGLPALRNTIELVYLCLSCDLSMLRRFMTPSMLTFFETCYSNPGIKRLIGRLNVMTGAEMSALNRRALDVYQQITDAINTALSTEIKWTSSWQESLPLWKIIVANVGRLEIVAKQLHGNATLCASLEKLTANADGCIRRLIGEDYEVQP